MRSIRLGSPRLASAFLTDMNGLLIAQIFLFTLSCIIHRAHLPRDRRGMSLAVVDDVVGLAIDDRRLLRSRLSDDDGRVGAPVSGAAVERGLAIVGMGYKETSQFESLSLMWWMGKGSVNLHQLAVPGTVAWTAGGTTGGLTTR